MKMSPIHLCVVLLCGIAQGARADTSIDKDLSKIGIDRGIVAVIEFPDGDPSYPAKLAQASELTIHVQTADSTLANAARKAADAAGLLGGRVFISTGPLDALHLADNLADCVLVDSAATGSVPDEELLRIIRPRATAHVGSRQLVKPVPDGIDEWTHPYHGPDNNPQSTDQLVRGAFQTQFLGYPKFSPMPEQTVIAGGRIFKAMGHIAHKTNQNEMLNTLLCINAYNGTVLWKRPLPAGFMIHRNTMVATEDALFLGDFESCQLIDAETGKTREKIDVPDGISDGPVWKWMAISDGILYGLVGATEIKVDTQRSARRGLGHWPWGMWKGHDYDDPRTAFGFGRTVVAIDLKSKELLWHYRTDDFLDARAFSMSGNRLFCYSPQKFLMCINANDGRELWKNSDKDLLEAIGPNGRAQHYITGYATACYMKSSDRYVFFSGPQRSKLVAASADDGKLLWSYPLGNLQLVLRDDAVWAAGPQKTDGMRLDYETGSVLATFPARRACTRATGCADSIFYRANGGTVRVLTDSNQAHHIAPMRPPCQDGVLISNGHLYWGPWMCGCQLSFYGNIGLAPKAQSTEQSTTKARHPARVIAAGFGRVEPLSAHENDWTSYRADNARSDAARIDIADDIQVKWQAQVSKGELPTAPVAAGGLVFVADRTGAVQALDREGQSVWKTYTAGPIYYPPSIAHNRVYVGSADGRVTAFEAKTGRFLWSYRVAPHDRLISVYGKLISTWPVAGGVVVEDDTVYAAAGIAHYDGTYVVALDAITGELKAMNDTSGTIASEVDNGISVQGNLSIVDRELRFLAGGVYEVARYDLKTLRCLNEPKDQVTSQFRTAFYPYYPEYGKYLSLDVTCDGGYSLCHDASYEGSQFTNLSLQEPLPAGSPKPRKEAARWIIRRGGKPPRTLWVDNEDRRFTSFVVTDEQLLVTGHSDKTPNKPFIASMAIKDGTDTWKHEIPADAVKGGVAMDHDGFIYVSLENGQLVCFAPRS